MNQYMELAILEAKKGIEKGHGGPFGAVIVKDGEVLAKGHNQVVKNKDCTCHGEMIAIRRACKKLESFDLQGCEIYTTAEPCPMCLSAIMWANIPKIYYGCTVQDTEKIGFRDSAFYEYQTKGNKGGYMQELEREECLKLYQEYEKIPEKTHY